jgi:putative transposase
MRNLRVLQDEATSHVTSKINYDAMAMESAEVKKMFLDFIEKAKTKFQIKIWNFTVMDNHIHILIKPGKDASLSKVMQWIKCNFTKRLNKTHNAKGHLWGERFFSRIIRDEEDFARTSAYIDNNPVKAKLVKNAKNWKFGGLFYKLRGITRLVDEALDGELFFPASAPLSASPG